MNITNRLRLILVWAGLVVLPVGDLPAGVGQSRSAERRPIQCEAKERANAHRGYDLRGLREGSGGFVSQHGRYRESGHRL